MRYFRPLRGAAWGAAAAAILMGWSWTGRAQAVAVSQTMPAAQKQRVEELVRLDRAWGPEMTTRGMMLTLVERERSSDGVAYTLKAVGAPTDKTFVLLTWTLGDRGPTKQMFGVTVGSDGVARCGNLEGPCSDSRTGDPVELRFQAEPGEPVRVALMTQDNSAKLLAEEMPLPLVASEGSCTLRAVLLARNAEVVLVEGTGFPPSVPMTVSSTSNGETKTDMKRADSDGYFLMANLPRTEGADSGEVKIAVKSPTCAPSLTVPWGQIQLAQERMGEKKQIAEAAQQ